MNIQCVSVPESFPTGVANIRFLPRVDDPVSVEVVLGLEHFSTSVAFERLFICGNFAMSLCERSEELLAEHEGLGRFLFNPWSFWAVLVRRVPLLVTENLLLLTDIWRTKR